jgi:hypothetical protein
MHGNRINTTDSSHSNLVVVASSEVDSEFDTVEVWGSSPHGSTIFFTQLASLISFPEALNGLVKCTELRTREVFLFRSGIDRG